MSEVMEVIVHGKSFSDFESAADFIISELDAAPQRAASRLTRELRRFLQLVAKRLEQMHSSPWNGRVVNPSDNLQKRTGMGLRSIFDSIKVTGGAASEITGQISTGTMTIHETGGVITAKTSKYLTIPLPAAMDSRGVPLKRSARDWENTFVQRSRKGNLIIFQRNGKGIVPLYLLKPSVKIKPRLRMEETIMGELPYFQERLLDIIAEELSR